MAVEKFTDLPLAVPVAADLACIVTVPGDVSSKATVTSLVPASSVNYAKMQNVSSADRLLGRGNGSGSGVVQELTLDSTLALTTTALGVADGSLANAKLANMAQSTIKGRALAAGTGVPTDLTAAQVLAILGIIQGTLPVINNFRPTLATGFPIYAPQPATPASTDTTAETTTFASGSPAADWVTGTIATTTTTGGGLTAGTRYFLRKVSSLVVSYHTTVADAESGGSPVNLSANITVPILPSGVSSTTLRFTPYNGNIIALYSGSVWIGRTSAEMTLAVGTVTANLPYDVFCYDNSGTPTLEMLAWTSATVRATAIALQDGIPIKSGDTTRRLVFTFVPDSTTTAIDDAGGLATNIGGKRRIAGVDNQVRVQAKVFDSATSWVSATGIRSVNNIAGNSVDFVQPLIRNAQSAVAHLTGAPNTNGVEGTGIGIDSTSTVASYNTAVSADTGRNGMVASWDGFAGIGLHTLNWNEMCDDNGTSTFFGLTGASLGLSGMTAIVCI